MLHTGLHDDDDDDGDDEDDGDDNYGNDDNVYKLKNDIRFQC